MTTFIKNPLFPDATDEQVMDQLRLWRNQELANTDWTMISDASTDKAAWATYRQALRDLPAKVNITKPVTPVRPTE